jgi:hypothetical protein
MLGKERGLGVKGIKLSLDMCAQGWFIHRSCLTEHDPLAHGRYSIARACQTIAQ